MTPWYHHLNPTYPIEANIIRLAMRGLSVTFWPDKAGNVYCDIARKWGNCRGKPWRGKSPAERQDAHEAMGGALVLFVAEMNEIASRKEVSAK